MKYSDLNVHRNFNYQLSSIKVVSETGERKQAWNELLKALLFNSECVIVQVERYNYGQDLARKLVWMLESSFVKQLEIESDMFSISFWEDSTKLTNKKHVLTDLWNAFEQPLFCFLANKENLSQAYTKITTNKKLTWNKITQLVDCFVIFKSTEEDVVWIGKSNELSFKSLTS